MTEFFHALVTFPFMQNAVLAGVLASIACGITGTYVVVKRIAFIGGGISHAVLGGMGIAYYLGANPLTGAVAAALVAAIVIGTVRLKAHQHEDTLVSALWAVGMAVGIIFIAKTPGYNVDLTSFLFGNILMVTQHDLVLIGVMDLVILVLVGLFFRPFLAISFDEEYARLRGVPVEIMYLLLLCLIALTVVILIQVVGLILVIALLTLPAAIAGQYTRRMGPMMIAASVLGFLFTTVGLAVSFSPDLPAGATIILLAGGSYIVTVVGRRLHTRFVQSRQLGMKRGYENAR